MGVRDLVDVAPQQSVSAAAQTSISDTASLVLSADPKRKGLMIQNTGTTVLKFTFDGSTPTQTVYHIALAACTAANDGKGGIYVDDACVTEVRGISSAAGGTAVITAFRTGSPDWNQAMGIGL